MLRKILFTTLVLIALTGCATSPTGRSQLMLVSNEQAIASSRTAYASTIQSLQREGKLHASAELNRRVRIISGRLVYQAIELYPKSKNWAWEVRVVDEPDTLNAWCMAGGKMVIYTGIINKLSLSDDEIAQVMGHEISHALANHSAEKMSMAMASSLGTLGVAIATKDSDNRGAILGGTALAATLAVNLPNSRAAENEADVMGIRLAALAGYNPNAAVTLWQKMEKSGGATPPEFLSTHPSPANRQSNLARLADEVMPLYMTRQARPVYPLP